MNAMQYGGFRNTRLRKTTRCAALAVRFVVGAVLALLSVTPLRAFQLTPMSAVIDPQGSLPAATFELSNGGTEPVAVQVRAMTRSIQPDGTELNSDASHQLQVFPSQVILRPNTTQTVRVRWTGNASPARELPFRIVAEQLPINLQRRQEESSTLQFMLRYRATLYVRPPGTESRIVVDSLQIDRERHTAVLHLANRGNRHQSFAGGRLLLTDIGGTEHQLNLETLEPFVTVNILPGGERRVAVPMDLLPAEPAAVQFLFSR